MADLKAPKRNDVIGRLADILQSGKDTANQYQILPQVPLIGGTGLGDMFMGKAPELINDISYDGLQAAIRGGNTATGGIGTYGARPAVADAALLGLDVAGIGKGLGGLSRRSASAIYDKLVSGGTSLSRRDALKKLGAITGGAAVTGGTLGVARKLLDNVATDVAPKIADNVAVQAAKKYKFNSLGEYIASVKHRAKEEARIQAEEFGIGFSEKDLPNSVDDWTRQMLKQDEDFYTNYKLRTSSELEPTPWEIDYNPETNQFTSLFADEVLSPQAKQEMKDFKTATTKLHTDYGGTNPNTQWLEWIVNAPENNPNYYTEITKVLK